MGKVSSASKTERAAPMLKGIFLGLAIGVVYCWFMQDVALTTLLQMPANLLSFNATGTGSGASRAGLGEAGTGLNHSYWLSDDGPPLPSEEQEVRWVLALWEASALLNFSRAPNDTLLQEAERNLGHLRLKPPHLDDCAARTEEYRGLDSRNADGSRPQWTLWKGRTASIPHKNHVQVDDTEEFLGDTVGLTSGPLPPWVEGGEEDNFPMTRRVQRDLWLLQHPRNCSHESVRFLLANWPSSATLGLGAQVVYVGGLLSIAMQQKRVLVLENMDRAGHEGCRGSDFKRWSCYFLPETTSECRATVTELKKNKTGTLADGKILMGPDAKPSPWFVPPPSLWGEPWEDLQPTSEVGGELVVNYKKKFIRWWRSQSVRYFMRFPSEYTCMMLNQARHDAFGVRAAIKVLRAAHQTKSSIRNQTTAGEADMEKWVWQSQKPWIPRPMLNVHVRLGDKAKEMTMVDFYTYMDLATRLRTRFPQVQNIWLSSEMQDVIDSSKLYQGWNFYYTNVPRQTGNTSMSSYERSLGGERSTRNSIVNFLMASDADYFVGALGSTWCFLIDGMRSTSGKLMSGYLSVNKDRFWRR